MTRKLLFGPLALVAALAACVENETTNPPTANPDLVNPLFARYVAFGNSITAGLQSGGINDSTQQRSYAVLLAGQMGTEFNYPSLRNPGCPAPIVNIFTQERVPGPACAARDPDIPEYLHNVAWPGSDVVELLTYFDPSTIPSGTDVFRTFLLGGRTPYEAAKDVKPTFVTIWIGNNDATSTILDVVNPGDPNQVRTPAEFATRFGAFMDSLDAIGTIQGGVIIGAAQAPLSPYATQGRAWKAFELQYDALLNFKIDSATGGVIKTLNTLDIGAPCLAFSLVPGTSDTVWTSIPFHVGGPALAGANAKVDSVLAGTLSPVGVVPVTVGCTDAQAVTNTEMLNIVAANVGYNTAMAAEAEARDWIFIDPNPFLLELALAGGTFPFPAFPGLPGIPLSVSIETPFGPAISRDGFHPSTSTHRATADVLIEAINAKYGTQIPPLPN